MEELNPRATIGGNNPPLSPREVIEMDVADLLEETEGCAFGAALESQEQADQVAGLYRRLQKAAKAVDEQASTEKAPHDTAIKAIDNWRNGLTAKGLKKTADGKLTKAILATGNLSAGWIQKLDNERKERERQALAEAARIAKEAAEAAAAAAISTDLQEIEEAEAIVQASMKANKEAAKVAKERVRIDAGEGERGLTVRKVYSAKVTSHAAAYGHYKQQPQFMADFHALIESYAQRDAKNQATRCAKIPGVQFDERIVV